MSYGNKADLIYFDEIFNETLDMIYEDIFGDYDCSYLGTFAEVKSVPNIENIKMQEDKITYKWVNIGGILNEIQEK